MWTSFEHLLWQKVTKLAAALETLCLLLRGRFLIMQKPFTTGFQLTCAVY
jgi:hypothetical protein